MVENQRAIIDLMKAVSQFAAIPIQRNCLDRDEKEKIIEIIEHHSKRLSLKEILELLGVLKSSYYRWRTNSKCSNKEQEICPRINIHKLTDKEIGIMKSLVESSDYSHFSVKSLCMFAQRKSLLYCAPATWQKYAKLFKWSRRRIRVYPKTNRIGVRAEGPNEIWHIDVTRMKLPNNEKYYIQTVIDNYSRYVIAWNIDKKIGGIKTSGLLQEALKVAFRNRPTEVPNVFVDGGFENINEHVEKLIDEGTVERTIAQVDVNFSNSMVEALFKSLKNNYLYHRRINTLAELTEHVRFYFQQHNEVIPHVSLNGATPKEVFEKSCIKGMRAEITKFMEQVRKNRVVTNRKVSCGTCNSPNVVQI